MVTGIEAMIGHLLSWSAKWTFPAEVIIADVGNDRCSAWPVRRRINWHCFAGDFVKILATLSTVAGLKSNNSSWTSRSSICGGGGAAVDARMRSIFDLKYTVDSRWQSTTPDMSRWPVTSYCSPRPRTFSGTALVDYQTAWAMSIWTDRKGGADTFLQFSFIVTFMWWHYHQTTVQLVELWYKSVAKERTFPAARWYCRSLRDSNSASSIRLMPRLHLISGRIIE